MSGEMFVFHSEHFALKSESLEPCNAQAGSSLVAKLAKRAHHRINEKPLFVFKFKSVGVIFLLA